MRVLIRQLFSAILCFALGISSAPFDAAQTSSTPSSSTPYLGQGVPMSASELQKLVAPIALYPDALVAQILGAATFPDQVSVADAWLQQVSGITGNALTEAVNAEPWDPSVKALTQFPTVLDTLAKNLSWTSALGEAYHTQAADVLSAIQTLRAQAKAAGNLNSSSQIKVIESSPQIIEIQPANPQVVYVPVYNPAVIYGYPYVTPGYSAATVATTGVLAFGAGIAVGALIASNSCCGWGYSYWGCNWHGGAVVYGSSAYYGNSAWHGGYYGSSVTAYGPYGTGHYGAGYNPYTGTYARGGSVSTPYGTRSAGSAYNPYTGTYAHGQSVSTPYGTRSAGEAYNPYTGNYAHGASGSGPYGSAAVGETSNGNKYAAANGNEYRNTGDGWQKNDGGSWNNVQHPSSSSWADSSAASHGWGGEDRSSGSSAWGGGGDGWDSRASSARGWGSGGGGGGWGGRGGGGFRR